METAVRGQYACLPATPMLARFDAGTPYVGKASWRDARRVTNTDGVLAGPCLNLFLLFSCLIEWAADRVKNKNIDREASKRYF